MDGTLVANSPVHIRAFEIFCDRYGVRGWKEKLGQAFGMGNDDIMRLIMPEEVIREKGLATRRRPSTAKSTLPKSNPCRDWSPCWASSAMRAYAAP